MGGGGASLERNKCKCDMEDKRQVSKDGGEAVSITQVGGGAYAFQIVTITFSIDY